MKARERAIKYSVGVILLVTALTGFYYWYHLRVSMSSDSTTMIPVAMDLINGNFLLRGWVFGTNNFLFSETIFYLPGLLAGVETWKLLYFVPGLTFAALLVINSYVFLFYGKQETGEKRKLCTASFYILLIGAISYPTAYTLLNANSHNGVYVFIGVEIWLVFRYLDTKKYRYVIAYTIIGTLMQFSDGVFLMALIAPAAALCLYSGVKTWLAGKREETVLYGVLFGATCGIYVLAKALAFFFQSVGGMETRGLPMQLMTPAQALERLLQYRHEAWLLWGYQDNARGGIAGDFYNFMVIVLFVLTMVAFFFQIYAIIRGTVSRERMMLWLVVLFNIGGCLFTDTVIFRRYLVPAYIYGILLLILTVSDLIKKNSGALKSVLALGLVLCAGMAAYRIDGAADIGDQMEAPKQVAAYLEEHDMGNGYGDFWSASLIAGFTDFQNQIYPVYAGDEMYPYVELVKAEWYDQKDIHYIVVNAGDENNHFCKKQDAVAILGEPNEDTVIGPYEILYWDKDISEYLKK